MEGLEIKENLYNIYSLYRGFIQSMLTIMYKSSIWLLLVRDEDVQVLHGFDSVEHAQAYLTSKMFTKQVAPALQPTWAGEPEIKIYGIA